MGVEFRLGRDDHLKVEDFLEARPEGVHAVAIEAKNIDRQANVIDAAKAAGVEVLVEPLTERLAEEHFEPGALEYANEYPIRPESLLSLSRKAELVERVAQHQVDIATILTAPHFYAEDERLLDLNVAMAAMTVQAYGKSLPVRAILCAKAKFFTDVQVASRIAAAYTDAGVASLEVRLSPFGGENEGASKVRTAFAALERVHQSGVEIIFGYQGNIGQTALALGLVDHYSAGIGYRERYNHAAEVSRQRQLHSLKERGSLQERARGPSAGVYLPGAGITVSRKTAQFLYKDSAIRSKLACHIAGCGKRIDMPATDPRTHYMHSKAESAHQLLSRPPSWRPTLERDRLAAAAELRTMLNAHHLPAEAPRLSTRTLDSLIIQIDNRITGAQSA